MILNGTQLKVFRSYVGPHFTKKKTQTEIVWWQKKPVLYSSWAFTLYIASFSCGLEKLTSGLLKIFTSFKRQVLKQNSQTWNNSRKYSYKVHS